MRVVVTSIFYAPEQTGIAPYTTELAEHLVRRGHDVTVFTAFPNYPEWRVFDDYRGRLRARETRAGVDVRRHWLYVPRSHGAVARAAYEASFLAGALSALAGPRPDAVLGVTPAVAAGVAAAAAARRWRRPYGLVVQDLAAPAARQSGVAGGGRVAGLVARVEGAVARGAARVAVVADGFGPYLESLGVAPGRIVRVRNWNRMTPGAGDRDEGRALLGVPHDAFVCLHAGNMGHKQGLETVVECARVAAERRLPLRFVLVGDGNQRPALERLAASHALDNVAFVPVQPSAALPSVLAAADVLLLSQRPAVTDMALPSKLTAYFAAGRPVVASIAAGSEAAREIDAAGAGVVGPPGDPVGLLDALERVRADPRLGATLGARGRAYVDAELAPERALADFETLLDDVAHARGRR
ncbi:MAG TPA: WcaI family glycosyltransferase [Actinomycetota bacterium]|nr:WcaI family glycosyltransferase [Actinomycetota bacterium]